MIPNINLSFLLTNSLSLSILQYCSVVDTRTLLIRLPGTVSCRLNARLEKVFTKMLLKGFEAFNVVYGTFITSFYVKVLSVSQQINVFPYAVFWFT